MVLKSLSAENANKMAEENQVQQVTTKDPKKVEAGKRLAEYNRKRREELKAQKSEVSQYYGIGAVLAVGVIGGLGYYIYLSKKDVNVVTSQQPHPQQPSHSRPQVNKFEME